MRLRLACQSMQTASIPNLIMQVIPWKVLSGMLACSAHAAAWLWMQQMPTFAW